jgi:hypothetical protein
MTSISMLGWDSMNYKRLTLCSARKVISWTPERLCLHIGNGTLDSDCTCKRRIFWVLGAALAEYILATVRLILTLRSFRDILRGVVAIEILEFIMFLHT